MSSRVAQNRHSVESPIPGSVAAEQRLCTWLTHDAQGAELTRCVVVGACGGQPGFPCGCQVWTQREVDSAGVVRSATSSEPGGAQWAMTYDAEGRPRTRTLTKGPGDPEDVRQTQTRRYEYESGR